MGQGLDRLSGLDIGPDGDGASEVVGAAVGPSAVAPLQAEAGLGHLVGQGVPQAVRGLAGEQGGADIGQWLAVGLGDVPHVRHPKAPHDADQLGPLGRLLVVDRSGPADTGRQDGDAPFTLAHLAAEALPGPVAGHPGGVGTLGQDEQDVVGRVAVEPGGDGEELPPVLALDESLELVEEPVVDLGELGIGHGTSGVVAPESFSGQRGERAGVGRPRAGARYDRLE
jgi:hypothetical protein